MALGGQIVNFVGLYLLNDADQVGGIGEVAIVQDEVAVVDVRILIQMVDAVSVEGRGAPFDSMNDIVLSEQQFR